MVRLKIFYPDNNNYPDKAKIIRIKCLHSDIFVLIPRTRNYPDKITGWAADEGTILSMEEGTEPPGRGPNRGFSGLVNRSRITNDAMPTGPDHSVAIQEPDIEEFHPPPKKEPIGEIPKANPFDEAT